MLPETSTIDQTANFLEKKVQVYCSLRNWEGLMKCTCLTHYENEWAPQ